ncbi:histidine kinase [Virgibacillus phasianinus]|uniref:Histidine kinase n=1 Tax=Virgibacillus phasianinus TaxID=2017483 RepID=A0A220U289_9BACI|nr:PAS domain S-box protein [Virgibacillus phasianinus]ASK62268.1 histidine kinase [Virgibacillus phasianinus]
MGENISEIDYEQVVEYALDPVIIHTQLKILYINNAAEKFFKAPREEVIGESPLDIFKETSRAAIETRIGSAYNQPAAVIEETIYKMDGTAVDVELYCHPVRIGDKKAIQTYIRDITARRAVESNQVELENEIYKLSSTVVPLMDKIAVLPLLGSINEERAIQILHNVPVNVQKKDIEYLIVDFSGIYRLDNIVTEYIFRITSVLSMIGVQTIVTGLRPELALTATQRGINFPSTPTMASVKDALHYIGFSYDRKEKA